MSAVAPAQPPKDPARLVVLVSGSGTNLQALLDAQSALGPRWYGAQVVAGGAPPAPPGGGGPGGAPRGAARPGGGGGVAPPPPRGRAP
ncbi:hypothetical protein ACGFX7_17495, partial [Streptomyces harbinensis]